MNADSTMYPFFSKLHPPFLYCCLHPFLTIFFITGLKVILREPHVWVFLSMILILGFFNGVLITFAYLYLRFELEASQLCLGACVLTTVLVEVPMLFISGKIVEKVCPREIVFDLNHDH